MPNLVLPCGVNLETVYYILDGPKDQQCRDLKMLLSLLKGWETFEAIELRQEIEEALADLLQ